MIGIIQRALAQELLGRHYNVCVDLGCGKGDAAPILRKHVDYLTGVDNSENGLKWASARNLYDELILADVTKCYITNEVDLVVFMEVVEHLSHQDGEQLLNRLWAIPNVIMSTPRDFFPNPRSMPHISLWTEEELHRFSFKTRLLSGWFQPIIIFATRYSDNNI